MNNALQVFTYKTHQVRTTTIDGEVWFVAKDICDILEIADTHTAIRELDEDEKGGHNIPTPGGMQDMTIINEPGLYKLIFKSRKPEAKSFTRWVTHDVLPSIRKTGSYSLPEAQPTQKSPTPYMSRARFNATERIIKAALKCKTEQDFQAVIALDRAFQKRTGYSALEDAGFELVTIYPPLVRVPFTYNNHTAHVLTSSSEPPHFSWKHNLPTLLDRRETL